MQGREEGDMKLTCSVAMMSSLLIIVCALISLTDKLPVLFSVVSASRSRIVSRQNER